MEGISMELTYSLDELSERFFLSKYHICRLFKEAAGVTVSEYVNIQIVRKARHYLEETKLSVSEIAGLLGYGSMTCFEKIFKRYMQATPLEYRKNQNRFAPIQHEEKGSCRKYMVLLLCKYAERKNTKER